MSEIARQFLTGGFLILIQGLSWIFILSLAETIPVKLNRILGIAGITVVIITSVIMLIGAFK